VASFNPEIQFPGRIVRDDDNASRQTTPL
jgi:hypothetical protein